MFHMAAKLRELTLLISIDGTPSSAVGMALAFTQTAIALFTFAFRLMHGACWEQHWLQWSWTREWEPVGIVTKELVPIIMSCAVWGHILLVVPSCSSATTLA